MIILMYHSISAGTALGRYAVSPGSFRAQMAWLKRQGFSGLALRDGISAVGASDRGVVITFDDGYADNHATALPILNEFGFSATMFVATDFVGGANDWETGADRVPMMNWDQLRELSAAGMEIGSHSCSHIDVRKARPERLLDEVTRSRAAIAAETGQEATSFAHPYGFSHPDLPGALAQAGYRQAVLAATYGTNRAGGDAFELHRTPVWNSDGMLSFGWKVRGWCGWRYYGIRLGAEVRWMSRHMRRSVVRAD